MNDIIFLIILLMITIIILGFAAPPLGFAASIVWATYGITRLIQELANRDDVI